MEGVEDKPPYQADQILMYQMLGQSLANCAGN